MTVFIDTSALYALLAVDDVDRPAALATLEGLTANLRPLLTHEYVVVEAFTLLQRRLGLPSARSLVQDILPVIEIIWVDGLLHDQAREAALTAGRRGVSLVDWTSFLVMRRHGITTAFAFDADFAAQGFEVIPAMNE